MEFDPRDELDKAVLAAYAPLGIEPGKAFDTMGDYEETAKLVPFLFQPKGKTTLKAISTMSVICPSANLSRRRPIQRWSPLTANP